MDEKECYVCYRVERLAFYTNAFDLYDNEDDARLVASYSADLLKKAYFKDFRSVCGRHARILVGAGLYLSGLLLGYPTTQNKVSKVVGATQVSIRNMYKQYCKTLEIDYDRLHYKRKRVKCTTCIHNDIDKWSYELVNSIFKPYYFVNASFVCPETKLKHNEQGIFLKRLCVNHVQGQDPIKFKEKLKKRKKDFENKYEVVYSV